MRSHPFHLLILGGTTEAVQLARLAVDRLGERVDVLTSLAGRVASPRTLPGRVRIGGFGGIDGMIDTLKKENIDWVIDATHPFANTISHHARAACDRAGIPRLQLMRPPWKPDADTPWIEADDLAAAARLLPDAGKRVFLTIGKQGLDAFSVVAGTWFLVRFIEPPSQPLPMANYEVIAARPPHTVNAERAIMRQYDIDLLITKQSGGGVTETKLTAAYQEDIPIIMINRPLPEPGEIADSAEDALRWLEERLER